MPNPYRHRVNYCLQEAGRALAAGKGMAQQETAVFFLYRAYTTYLRELAEQLKLPDQAFQSAAALAAQLDAVHRMAESVNELVASEQSGWVASLQRQWQACMHPQNSEPKADVILTAVAEPEWAPAELLAAFESLLERQRMTGEEW
ncbi:MAG TPA: DUF6586 family protein [Pseudomonadales bacterium]